MKTLDLHGARHEDAEILIEDFLLLHDVPFVVITGNSNQMKNYLRVIVSKYSLSMQVESPYNLGSFYVY